jgi:hypothetical protein
MLGLTGLSEPKMYEGPAVRVLRVLRDYNRPLPQDFLAKVTGQSIESVDDALALLLRERTVIIDGDNNVMLNRER